jgi:hypothetical protein
VTTKWRNIKELKWIWVWIIIVNLYGTFGIFNNLTFSHNTWNTTPVSEYMQTQLATTPTNLFLETDLIFYSTVPMHYFFSIRIVLTRLYNKSMEDSKVLMYMWQTSSYFIDLLIVLYDKLWKRVQGYIIIIKKAMRQR